MILFLVTFFLVYGGVHAYAFLKVRAALNLGLRSGITVILFMGLMVLAPVLIRVAEGAGLPLLPRILACIGYLWMGLLFLFFSVSAVMDICRLFVHAVGMLLEKDLSLFSLQPGTSFAIALAFSILVSVYGYFEAEQVRIEQVTIRTPNISAEVGRVRIVQISDVHLGLIVREQRLKRMIQKVREAGPDLLVSTGDLVDGQIDNLDGLSEILAGIRPRYGKFAVMGNHEYYAGIDQALDFTRKAGFTMLRNEGVTAGCGINIAGADDPAGRRFGLKDKVSEKELLQGLPHEPFTLLLKHRPVVDPGSIGLFDLQLSGHVHKGQIFPFNLITWLFYPVRVGHLVFENGSYLYVSRGSGTWGPPIRFLAPPEVTVIELVHEV